MNQNLVQLRVICPPRSFVTPECFYKQPLNRSRWFFACITPRHTQKNVAIYWYNELRRFSIIITWRHKIATHFTREKNIFRTFRIPSCCNILAHFLWKRHLWKLMLMLLIFLHSHFVRNCSQFVILWQLRRPDWFVNYVFCTWYTLFFMPIHQQVKFFSVHLKTPCIIVLLSQSEKPCFSHKSFSGIIEW